MLRQIALSLILSLVVGCGGAPVESAADCSGGADMAPAVDMVRGEPLFKLERFTTTDPGCGISRCGDEPIENWIENKALTIVQSGSVCGLGENDDIRFEVWSSSFQYEVRYYQWRRLRGVWVFYDYDRGQCGNERFYGRRLPVACCTQ